MGEKSAKKRRRGGTISEEDISILFQRYSATTVLALLQEVGQTAAAMIDWESLVRKTATGISNAREYQMVWRHLAYRHGLDEKIEVGAEPLEDDSDLEYELEASPPVNTEASAEAAACVKVLIASGLPNEVNVANGSAVQASMTINVPKAQFSKAALGNTLPSSSIQGTNITVPVSIQKQSSAGIVSEAGETTGTADNSQAFRKRRKTWSEEEDMKLIAAVKKYGEGNWVNAVKGDFEGDRTTAQLSQRWNTIKRKNISEAGGTNFVSSHLYEQTLATRRAIDMALKDNSLTSTSGNSNSNRASGNGAATASNPKPVNASGVDLSSAKKDPASQKQPHHPLPVPSASNGAVSGPPSNPPPNPLPRPPPTMKSSVNPTITPDSRVKAAAVAAGARIASKDEATIFKEAQSKKSVHFPVVKPSGPAAGSLLPPVSVPGHPNVKFFRSTASAVVPASSSPLPVAQANLSKPPASSVAQANLPKPPASTVVQANIPRPPASSVALPQSVRPPPSVTTAAATSSPLAAGNHRVEGNGPRLAVPPVLLPQSVKLAPAVATTAVLPRPLHQPVRAPVATSTIVRPGIPSAETAAATCSPSTEQGKLPVKIAGPLNASVKASGIVKMASILSVQAPAATCSPPIRPQGNQALKTVGPIQVPGSSTKLNVVVQKNAALLQKPNPVQPQPMPSKVVAAMQDQSAAGPSSTKTSDVAVENGVKMSGIAVQDKNTNVKDGNVVQVRRQEIMNNNPKVLPSSTEGVSVVKSAGVEGSKACS